MSVETWAMTAYYHAKVTLVIGASNQPHNVRKTKGWSSTMVTVCRRRDHYWARQGTHWVMRAPKAGYDHGDDPHERELSVARRAAQYRAGNCGENAALVYAFLHERARDKHIGYVSRMSCDAPGDHEFVVINRRRVSGKDFPAFWGGASIVVDPWWGVVCSGSDLAAANGGCIFSEKDIDPEQMQDYVKYHGVTCITEFDTGAPA